MQDENAAESIGRLIDSYNIAGGTLLVWLTPEEEANIPKPRKYLFGLIRIGPSRNEIRDWGEGIRHRSYMDALSDVKERLEARKTPRRILLRTLYESTLSLIANFPKNGQPQNVHTEEGEPTTEDLLEFGISEGWIEQHDKMTVPKASEGESPSILLYRVTGAGKAAVSAG